MKVDERFDEFWKHYPRKVAKKEAKKIWLKIDDELYFVILNAIKEQAKNNFKEKENTYIPHAASWLNGDRWEDAIERETVKLPCKFCGGPADDTSRDNTGQEYGWCRGCQPNRKIS